MTILSLFYYIFDKVNAALVSVRFLLFFNSVSKNLLHFSLYSSVELQAST